MANVNNPILTGLSSWVDEESHGKTLLTKALLTGNSISRFNQVLNVKGKTALALLDTSIVLQDATQCGWNASGSNEISQKIVEPKYLKINTSWCAKRYLDTYLSYSVKVAAGVKDVQFEEDFIRDILAHLDTEIDRQVWQGSSANTNEFQGLIEQLEADATVNVVTAAAGTAIYSWLKSIYMAIPQQVLKDSVIYCSDSAFRGFIQELVSANLYHFDPRNNGDEYYLPGTDVKVVRMSGLDGAGGTAFTEIAVAAQNKNLLWVTNLTEDIHTLQAWYDISEQEERLAIEFMAGVSYVYGSEIVLGKLS